MVLNSMKKIVILTCYTLITLLFFAPSAQANELTPRQLEIVQIVINPDGYITKDLHAEFWALVPVEIVQNKKIRNQFLRLMKGQFVYALQFQREAWECMKASLESGKIIKTPQYISAKNNVLLAAPEGTKVQFQQSINNAEEMIRVAATKSPFHSTKGTFYITHELVDKVLAGLDGSFSRANQLINPRWGQTLQEYTYPEAYVSVLSSSPFSVEKKQISMHGNNSVEMTMLTRTIDDHNALLVSFYRTPKTVDGDSLLRIAESTITGSGATPSSAYSTQWRKKESALSSGTGNNSDGNFYVSTRVVSLKSIQAVLTVMAVSTISKSEADLLREQLEQSIQLLN